MKNFLLVPTLTLFSLLGAGCAFQPQQLPSTPQTQPPTQSPETPKPVEKTDTPKPQISAPIWKTFSDKTLGYSLDYPVLDADKTWSPSSGILDVSDFPKLSHIKREVTVKAIPSTTAITCSENDQIKNPLGTVFCYDTQTEGAAGSSYRTDNYRTMVNGTLITLTMVTKYVNDPRIIEGCETMGDTDPLWETTCRPFDEKKDREILDGILKSIGPSAVSDAISLITAEIKKKKPEVYEITVSFPQIDKGDATIAAAFNAAVRNPLEKEVNTFISDATQAEKDKAIGPGIWSYSMDAFATYQSPRIINSFLSGSVYTGGAHPNAIYQNVILDRVTKKTLHVSDLFVDAKKGLAFLSTISRKMLATKEAMNMSDNDWLNTGTEPKDQNFSQTHLTETGLTILFPAYQVAAYAAGPQEIQIPWKDLQGLIKTEYFPTVK
ncbi:DUF3298 domain-containing protein [Candidatus Uhrbacteria bacterium]|nr:DUF3298 domain-containing protein [Candidatus Uhrbacteria bacterium]